LGVITLQESVPIVARIEVPPNLLRQNLVWGNVVVRADAIEGPFAFSQPLGSRVTDRGSPEKTATFYVPAFGRYVISMDAPNDTFLTALRYAGRDILGTGMVLDGEPEGPLELQLGGLESVGSVTGTVRNIKFDAIARSIVVLIPDAGRRSNQYLFHNTSTDRSGAFVIRNVLPGDYMLFAWQEVEHNAWFDPEFLKDQERLGTRITIRPGLGTTQDLKVIESR